MIFFAVIMMDLLAGMEFDLFVPSFPQLQNHFHLSSFLVEMLLSVNFIGYCLSLFFVGGLADRYGRKPIILLGLVTFVLGSAFCAWGASFNFLLIGRFLQGIGVAAPAILSFLIIADSYPLKKQQFLMAMLNGSMNTAAAIAPVIGSYVTLFFHWRGNFTLLLLLGLTGLVMVSLFVPKYKLPEHKESLSLRGYLPIFQAKPLLLVISSIVAMCLPYWIFVGISPLLYMKEFGVSLAHFGYYQGVLALVFAIGSVIFGLLISKSDQKKMLYFSMQIFIVSLIMLVCIACFYSTNPLLITLAMLVFVIGQVVPSAVLFPLSLNYLPQAKGKVAAITQGSRLIFSAISLQIAGYLYQGSFLDVGIIIISFVLLAIITLFFVIRNRELMPLSHRATASKLFPELRWF